MCRAKGRGRPRLGQAGTNTKSFLVPKVSIHPAFFVLHLVVALSLALLFLKQPQWSIGRECTR